MSLLLLPVCTHLPSGYLRDIWEDPAFPCHCFSFALRDGTEFSLVETTQDDVKIRTTFFVPLLIQAAYPQAFYEVKNFALLSKLALSFRKPLSL